MKGIILSGGLGTRLYPLTWTTSKQLLPVYDKPMVYYPLSTLMEMGIQDILLITDPYNFPSYKNLLGDGSMFGANLTYIVQPEPKGIPQAFLLGADFIGNDDIYLILGDNIFCSPCPPDLEKKKGAVIYAKKVDDPQRYGIVSFDEHKVIIDLEEKPTLPKSNYAIAGLYKFDNDVIAISKTLSPSIRNELEIIDVLKKYLTLKNLHLNILNETFSWIDTGTIDSLLQAGNMVATMEREQCRKIGCPEEAGWKNGWISPEDLYSRALKYPNAYGDYLKSLVSK